MTGARLAGVRGPQCASHPAQATRLRRAAHRHVAVEHRGILTVWAVATHSSDSARPNPCKMGCSWVLLSREALILKALDAGIDQLGGECCSEVIVGQLRDGRLDETRLDVSVRRLPGEKSIHGLFDNPFKTDRPLFRFGHGLTK